MEGRQCGLDALKQHMHYVCPTIMLQDYMAADCLQAQSPNPATYVPCDTAEYSSNAVSDQKSNTKLKEDE